MRLDRVDRPTSGRQAGGSNNSRAAFLALSIGLASVASNGFGQTPDEPGRLGAILGARPIAAQVQAEPTHSVQPVSHHASRSETDWVVQPATYQTTAADELSWRSRGSGQNAARPTYLTSANRNTQNAGSQGSHIDPFDDPFGDRGSSPQPPATIQVEEIAAPNPTFEDRSAASEWSHATSNTSNYYAQQDNSTPSYDITPYDEASAAGAGLAEVSKTPIQDIPFRNRRRVVGDALSQQLPRNSLTPRFQTHLENSIELSEKGMANATPEEREMAEMAIAKDKEAIVNAYHEVQKRSQDRTWTYYDPQTDQVASVTGPLYDFVNDRLYIQQDSGQHLVSVGINQLLDKDDIKFVYDSWQSPAMLRMVDVEKGWIQANVYPRNNYDLDNNPIGPWIDSTFTWKASALCHKPLYFEQIQLERYGHDPGPILGPALAGAHFFANIAVLPYKMGIHPPKECVYALGYYRPGDCAPWLVDPIPLSLRGALFQTGAVMGMVYALP